MNAVASTEPLGAVAPGTLASVQARQQTAARLAGFLYLFTNATAILAFSLRGRLIVRGNAVETAANLAASETLFRLGTAAELVTVAGTMMLVAALYTVLRPVDRSVALLAVFWRLAENIVLATATLNALAALALLSGAEYLRPLGTAQLQALAFTFLRVHGAGFNVGFLFLGLGSTVFSYLWLRSRYIPRALAGLGIFASLTMALVNLAVLVFPELRSVVGMVYMAPMGLYEFGLGFWLLAKRLRAPEQAFDRESAA
jgi:hypothetical protein